MSANQRLQLAELSERDTEPDWYFTQLMKIADGRSIADIAEEYAVTYGALRVWIAASADREKMYQAAVRYRKEFVASKGRP